MKNIKLINILTPILVALMIIPADIVYVLSEIQNYLFKVFLYLAFFAVVVVPAVLVFIFYNKRNEKRIHENFNNKKIDFRLIIFISAIIEMLLLDVKSSNIPLTFSFTAKENSTVLIDQKLNVSNGADVKYF